MQRNSILKAAEKEGMVVDTRRHGYWDNVLYLNGTAICFDYTLKDKSFTIHTETSNFPAFATLGYIIHAVRAGAPNLGGYYAPAGFGAKKWTTWFDKYDEYDLHPWPTCPECGKYYEQFLDMDDNDKYQECPDCRDGARKVWFAGYCSLGAECALASLNHTAWELKRFASKEARAAWLEYNSYNRAGNVVARLLEPWETAELLRRESEDGGIDNDD